MLINKTFTTVPNFNNKNSQSKMPRKITRRAGKRAKIQNLQTQFQKARQASESGIRFVEFTLTHPLNSAINRQRCHVSEALTIATKCARFCSQENFNCFFKKFIKCKNANSFQKAS